MAKRGDKTSNRVWIELEIPRDEAHAKEIATRINRMLYRLNAGSSIDHFWWSENEGRWCYGGATGYKVCADHGHWFNLDYFGRD